MLVMEDSKKPDESRHVVGFYTEASERMVDDMNRVRDWLIKRRKLTRRFLITGRHPILFAPGIGGILIHEIIGHQFELSKAFSRYSPTKFKRGHKLFSDNVTVVDGPLCVIPGIGGNFDDEGTIKTDTVMIEAGAINLPLTDKKSIAANPGYPLTGNCRRETSQDEPASRMYCTYLKNGTDLVSQAVESIDYGFYVEQVSYAACSHRRGRVIMCVGRAKVIKKGEITDTAVTFIIDDDISSFFNFKFVCDDLLIQSGICHSSSGVLYIEHGSPTIGFENINVVRGFM